MAGEIGGEISPQRPALCGQRGFAGMIIRGSGLWLTIDVWWVTTNSIVHARDLNINILPLHLNSPGTDLNMSIWVLTPRSHLNANAVVDEPIVSPAGSSLVAMSSSKEGKRTRGEIACAECRRYVSS